MDERISGQRQELDVLDMHEALERLALAAPRPARLIELRFFGGLDVKEAARVLGIGETTAIVDWRFARAWLAERLATGSDP
jgi:DNA-directed RNA polymerase specialized sigma24 family protein